MLFPIPAFQKLLIHIRYVFFKKCMVSMKKCYKSTFLIFIMIEASPAFASFEHKCVYEGELISNPIKNKDRKWDMNLKILKSAPIGRADGGCIKGEMKISVSVGFFSSLPKTGQKVWVEYSFQGSDDPDSPSSTTISLIKKSDFEKIMTPNN